MVFFATGAASIMLQVSWQRLLTLVCGVGPVSITVVVSVYMLGLGLGSLLGGYLADRTRRPAQWYFAIQLCLGAFSLLSLPFLALLENSALSSQVLAMLYSSAFLLMPTLAMGMTLPLLIKELSQRGENFLHSVAHYYFVNTLGAAFGALFSSYVLISLLGLDRTVYVAAGIELLAGAAIYLSWNATGSRSGAGTVSAPEAAQPKLLRLAYPIVLLAGFLGIGYEIVWMRVLETVLKASPYAFSTILAVYLLGIALGSRLLSRYLDRHPALERRSLYFVLQALIGAYVLLSVGGFYYLTKYTAFGEVTRLSFGYELHPADTLPLTPAGFFHMFDIVLWPVALLFVPTLLMGASFPLISALALGGPNTEGRTLGGIFFCNTMGNVLGGVLSGFVLLPALGTERTLLILALLSIGMFLFAAQFAAKTRLRLCAGVVAVAALLFPGAGQLYALVHPNPANTERYLDEGIDGVIMTLVNGEDVRTYIDGLAHGGRPGTVFYREAVETVAFTTSVKRALIIGYGTGSTTEAVLRIPELEKATLVELNATLLRNLRKIELFDRMLSDKRLDVVIDDGRRVLARNNERYDLIMIDPLRTTTAYSNNLYSREFFALAASRLTDGGVFMVWMDEDRVMPKTVCSAFPYVRIYECCCLASNQPLVERRGRGELLRRQFDAVEQERIAKCPLEFVGDQVTQQEISSGYPINEDWRPVCEYYLGLKIRKKVGGLR
jgi:predicted membrane-bound spermidine synthase